MLFRSVTEQGEHGGVVPGAHRVEPVIAPPGAVHREVGGAIGIQPVHGADLRADIVVRSILPASQYATVAHHRHVEQRTSLIEDESDGAAVAEGGVQGAAERIHLQQADMGTVAPVIESTAGRQVFAVRKELPADQTVFACEDLDAFRTRSSEHGRWLKILAKNNGVGP